MDPLSMTLAVITFATAIKDLVELAQAICDAFATVGFRHNIPLTVNSIEFSLLNPSV